MRYFLLWFILSFMVALSSYGVFRIWENLFQNTCYNFFAIISLALLPSSHFNLHIYFRLFCQTTIIEMPSLVRKEKFTCENCGTQTTRNNIVRHKKKCSIGTIYCIQCPNFFSGLFELTCSQETQCSKTFNSIQV